MSTGTKAKKTPPDLIVFRDDGVVAPLTKGIGGKFVWLLPPLLRGLEYGGFIALTALVEPSAMPYCFALLAALCFHHYDTVYRVRHQRVEPPAWIGYIGGGWLVRLPVAGVLAALGALGPGLLVAAVVLGAVYVTESVVSWWRFTQPTSMYESEEDEQE